MKSQRIIPTLRDRFEYALLRTAGALLRALPVDVASNLMGAAWQLLGPLTQRHRRARAHLRAAMPELSPAERRRILRRMWDNLGRVLAEAFHLDRILADPARVTFEIPEAVRALARSGKGCVGVSLHMGNWEIAALPARAAGFRPAGLYQRIQNPLVEVYVQRLRSGLYPGGLLPKGHATAHRALRHVREGHGLMMLGDLRELRGLAVPFFGRPAACNPFPAMVARATGAPLFVDRVVRLGGARFRIDIEEIAIPVTQDRDADIAAATAAIQATFEAWIREHPDQWMWTHRRWDGVEALPGEGVADLRARRRAGRRARTARHTAGGSS